MDAFGAAAVLGPPALIFHKTVTKPGCAASNDKVPDGIMRKYFAVLLITSAMQAQADCHVQSAATHPHLVELYTSEGCSSCPPADAWLRALPGAAVALAFHVDYWDALGWRDRFASARFTARQHEQASRERTTAVYTPQVVVDGRTWKDWYRNSALPGPQQSRVALTMAAVPAGASLQVHVDGTAVGAFAPDFYQTYVALSENGLTSSVESGENTGKRLRHDHVVRAWAGPLPWAGADVRLDVPADLDVTKATLIAFTQDRLSGDVAQVVRLPLAQCR